MGLAAGELQQPVPNLCHVRSTTMYPLVGGGNSWCRKLKTTGKELHLVRLCPPSILSLV